jgi:hypothetical protein
MHPKVHEYLSKIAKSQKPRPREYYVEIQKKSVEKRRANQEAKKLTTSKE